MTEDRGPEGTSGTSWTCAMTDRPHSRPLRARGAQHGHRAGLPATQGRPGLSPAFGLQLSLGLCVSQSGSYGPASPRPQPGGGIGDARAGLGGQAHRAGASLPGLGRGEAPPRAGGDLRAPGGGRLLPTLASAWGPPSFPTASRSVTPRLKSRLSLPGTGPSTASMSVSSAVAVGALSAPVSWRPAGTTEKVGKGMEHHRPRPALTRHGHSRPPGTPPASRQFLPRVHSRPFPPHPVKPATKSRAWTWLLCQAGAPFI